MKKILLFLFLAVPGHAQVCTTLDGTGFTQEQINQTQAIAYEIGYGLDNTTLPPTVTQAPVKQVTVCFPSASFNVATVITTATLVNQYQTDNTARNAAAVSLAALQTEFSTTTAQAGFAWNNWGTLTAGQKDTAQKNQVRIQQLRCLLGLDPC